MFRSGLPIVNRWRQLRLTSPRQLARFLAVTLFPPRCCLCGFEGASLDLDLCEFCRLKYQDTLANARVLGVLLAQAVRERGGPLPKLLVPVPLHISRLRERGFNQSTALARYAGRMLEIPRAPRALRRIRDTPSQTALDVGERHRNVRGAFALNGPRALRKLLDAGHIAVVDDVVTTGSTLNELRTVLLAAGVERVDLWAVARA